MNFKYHEEAGDWLMEEYASVTGLRGMGAAVAEGSKAETRDWCDTPLRDAHVLLPSRFGSGTN